MSVESSEFAKNPRPSTCCAPAFRSVLPEGMRGGAALSGGQCVTGRRGTVRATGGFLHRLSVLFLALLVLGGCGYQEVPPQAAEPPAVLSKSFPLVLSGHDLSVYDWQVLIDGSVVGSGKASGDSLVIEASLPAGRSTEDLVIVMRPKSGGASKEFKWAEAQPNAILTNLETMR